MRLNSLIAICLNHFVLIEVYSVDILVGCWRSCSVRTFRRSYRALPAGPTCLDLTPLPNPSPRTWFGTRFWPDFDPIRTRKGGFRVRIGSKSGQNRVRIGSGGRGSGGGQVQTGRSGWQGSVAPLESPDCTGFKRDSFRETHLWERFGQTGKIAPITCLKS